MSDKRVSEKKESDRKVSDKKRKLGTLIKVFGTLISLNIVVMLLFIYATPGVRGSGVLLTETFKPAPFDRVTLEGVGTVRIVIGGSPSLEITTDENLLPLLDVNVDEGNLIIRSKKELLPSVLLLAIQTPTLHGMKLAGNSVVEVFDLTGEYFSIGITDGGTAQVTGFINQLEIEIQGDGIVQALDLIADEARISIQGKGDAAVHARNRLIVQCEGMGEVRYAGSPKVQNNCNGIVEPI